jgi:hypothetical protein
MGNLPIPRNESLKWEIMGKPGPSAPVFRIPAVGRSIFGPARWCPLGWLQKKSGKSWVADGPVWENHI